MERRARISHGVYPARHKHLNLEKSEHENAASASHRRFHWFRCFWVEMLVQQCQRNANPQLGALPGFAANVQLTAQQGQPFAHA
jgi:hypothetical protein